MYDYNMTGYNRIFNNFGMKTVDRGIDIPDAALGIGFAELTAPVPVVSYSPNVTKMPPPSPIQDVTDTMYTGHARPITASDFGQASYMGEAIGGF